ncbi:hypothetical protein ABH945_003340 [Paraburkholderia sp. GAS333]|uniref:hypothetical protein n=1 Tax=Paraburkholderia sp. GAS333 TaxID=3156279 RepID=UPI003D1F7CB6
MQADGKGADGSVLFPFKFEQPEFIGPPAPRYRNPFASTLLFLSGVGLWGSAALGAGALLFGGTGFGAINQLTDLFTVAAPAAAGGVVLLVLYTLIQQPWRAGRGSLAFALQVPFALFVLLIVGLFELDAHRSAAQTEREAAHQIRLAADTDTMNRAIAKDDVTAFAPAYAECDDSSICGDSWVTQAILLSTPRIAAVTLQGVTPATYSQFDNHNIPKICRSGVLYNGQDSLAYLVGFRNSPAITALFAPLWGPADRDKAFLGAVTSGSTDLMDTLVTQGVDPRAMQAKTPSDDPYASAAAGGAFKSIHWLESAGVKVQTAASAQNMWTSFADWATRAPPELGAKGIDEWLAESSRIPYAPGAKLSPSDELTAAVQARSPALVAAMLQRGYSVKDLAAGDQASLKSAQPLAMLKNQWDRGRYCDEGDWKAAWSLN